MGKFTLTIEDNDTGGAKFSADFEPKDCDNPTKAQGFGLSLHNMIDSLPLGLMADAGVDYMKKHAEEMREQDQQIADGTYEVPHLDEQADPFAALMAQAGGEFSDANFGPEDDEDEDDNGDDDDDFDEDDLDEDDVEELDEILQELTDLGQQCDEDAEDDRTV